MQLNYTEKGVRKLTELLKTYQAALVDDEVVESFQVRLQYSKLMLDA